MKQYDFTQESINQFYENVYDESTQKIHEVMTEINNTHEQITPEQNARFEYIYNSIAINISIGNNTLTIPNNADFIEILFSAINECKQNENVL